MVTTTATDSSPKFEPEQETQRVILQGVSWQTYQALLADLGDSRSTRLTYEGGILEIIMPSKLHEIINRLLARIVTTLTEELDLDVVDAGSTTLNREDLERGAEPDTCFYIQNAHRLQGIDPEIPDDLPPDLVIEVDITSASTRRQRVYQHLGVPEVWRYTRQEGVTIYQLDAQTKEYVKISASVAFPMISVQMINQFLQQRQTMSENAVIRAVRSRVREVW